MAGCLAALLPQLAAGGVMYKSVTAEGTVMFSDTPPPSDARILEQRAMIDPMPAASSSAVTTAPAEQMLDYDAAIANANEKVDLAEHALALARRGIWSTREGLSLEGGRASRGDVERIEFYKKNLLIARQSLMELLRERKLASR
jgi:hypothetical protein